MNENRVGQEYQAGQETLHIGIDLGTSRSAIAASNGTKAWVKSYVGWPKDFVSAKMLGKDVLLGDEAIEKRLSLDVYRPLGQGVLKEGMERSADAVREIITHLIRLARPAPGQKVKAIIGVPAEALKVNKLAIMNAVSKYVSTAMVVSEPFAVAYGMDLLDNAFIIDIGAGTVDFCIMHGSMPEEGDQKTILQAGDYVDDQLYGYLTEIYPESGFTENMVRQFKEKYAFVGSVDGEIKVELPVNGKPVMHDIKGEVRRACESILPAITDTAAEMIAQFDPEFQNKVKNIVLAGGGSRIRNIALHVGHALREYGKCNVAVVEDPLYAGATGAMRLAMDMPDKYWEQLDRS
jgi:rod shape-determining protein MreB